MRDLPQNFVEGDSKGAVADAARRSRGRGRRMQTPPQGVPHDASTATRQTGPSGTAVRDWFPLCSASNHIDALIPPQYGSIFHCHQRDFMVLCRYRK